MKPADLRDPITESEAAMRALSERDRRRVEASGLLPTPRGKR